MLHVQQELWHYQLRGTGQAVLKKTDKIEQLLAGTYRDPENGEPIDVATRCSGRGSNARWAGVIA